MPNFLSKILDLFQHPVPTRPQRSPHKWLAPTHGSKVQYSPNGTTTPKLDKRGITCVQRIAGTFLHIYRAVKPTMLVALNGIGAEQASPTTDTINKTKMLMDYAATQLNAVIRFHTSDMCLHTNSNAAYLAQPKACILDAGHYYLSDNSPPPHICPTPAPNGPILTKCHTVRTVMTSAAEAKTGAISLNVRQAVPIRTTLIKNGSPTTAHLNQD